MSEIGQQIIEATRAIAAERAEFSYTGDCKYVEDGQPGCLIGHALWNLGLIDETFERVGAANGLDALACLEELSITVDSDEQRWLELAQAAQDGNDPWGKAVAFADASVLQHA